jgi:RluA family pseudouridine synthase
VGEPRVLLEDEEIVAAEKPAGVPTIAGRGDVGEPLTSRLERALGRKLWVVHRLDLDASGLVVLAKTAAAHARLCAAFERRGVRKSYLALVEGAVTGNGESDAPLREFGSGRVAASPKGKPSLTRYAPLTEGRGCTLLKVEPVTGRRHQIRVHLYGAGHPILGDRLYGAPRPVGGEPRLMLHALALELPGLPALRCPPPPDFAEVLARRGVPFTNC